MFYISLVILIQLMCKILNNCNISFIRILQFELENSQRFFYQIHISTYRYIILQGNYAERRISSGARCGNKLKASNLTPMLGPGGLARNHGINNKFLMDFFFGINNKFLMDCCQSLLPRKKTCKYMREIKSVVGYHLLLFYCNFMLIPSQK